MYASILSATTAGIHSNFIYVEVDISTGLPGIELVGLLSGEVREAKERVKVALKNAGINIPPMKITINLSPGNVRKEGTAFDLPIAAGLMSALGIIQEDMTKGCLFLGELGLNGEIKSVNGVLPIVIAAVESNVVHTVIVPRDNEAEASIIKGVKIVGIDDVSALIEYFCARDEQEQIDNENVTLEEVCKYGEIHEKYKTEKYISEEQLIKIKPSDLHEVDFADIHGQAMVKRAAEVATAGFHHMLLVGPPGSGKTMIAKRIPTIMPPLSMDESIEVSKIYSVAGLLTRERPLITTRPFLNPHHTITMTALAGGGRVPKPGIISLSHRGVLFLDELPEFRRGTIEIMRQPLEDRVVHIARNGGGYTYPSDFMLVAAMNPCPCGYYPDRNKCRCSPGDIRRYLNKISGPILDRIDITIDAPRLDISDLKKGTCSESSEQIRSRIMGARERQKDRYQGTAIRFNADLTASDIEKYCHLGIKEEHYIEQVFRSLELSARSYHRILRLSRTIADLDGSDNILEKHISEAVGYKMAERLWDGLEEM